MKKHVKTKKSFWKMGSLAAVSLVWLVIRTGGKPSRIIYPCQKAAVANINIFLLALFAPLLDLGKFRTALPHVQNSHLATTVLLVSSLLLAFGSVAYTGNYIPIEASLVPVPLDLQTHSAVSSVNSSDLFFVQNASGVNGNMDAAVSSLLLLMADHGLFFFKTNDEPSGLIGKDDVVILKVNSQWPYRGGTNTDLVKSVIKKILSHPENFTGEIVVADNGQGSGNLDWPESNAFDHSQSMTAVANAFSSYKVSTYLWDIMDDRSVEEYYQGDLKDGYVVNATMDPATDIHVSYPKFQTEYGTYISFKNGIWNNATHTYDSQKLKVINMPVLKSHQNYGVTACIKNYMGVQDQQLSNGHWWQKFGAMATEMTETRFPTLNILDAIWVNANPVESGSNFGPWSPYLTASFTNVVGASKDPVALDYTASKYILMPTAIKLGYTSYSSLDPEHEPPSLGGPDMIASFHSYLSMSMVQFNRAGFRTTMNESQMNVYVRYVSSLDVNGDGKVDMKDIAIVAKLFWVPPTDPRWNPKCDINGDGKVDMMDIAIVAKQFGGRYYF